MAFATFLVWRLRTGACGVGAYGFWRYRMPSSCARARRFSETTIQPPRQECHACCPLQAEKPGIQPVVGNTHGAHVEQVVSSFQKILRGSQLTRYNRKGSVQHLSFDYSCQTLRKKRETSKMEHFFKVSVKYSNFQLSWGSRKNKAIFLGSSKLLQEIR